MSDLARKFLESFVTPVEILGVGAQLLFFTRFLVQWLASEKRKAVVVPVAFWWCSIGGGVAMIVYAALKPAPNILLAQVPANFIYVRNIVLARRQSRAVGSALPPAGDTTRRGA